MIKDFFKKLRESDDARKRRWMIASTSVTMLLVIYLWLGYFNNIIADSSMQSAEKESAGGSFSFGQTMKMGMSSAFTAVGDGVKSLGSFLNQPKEYILELKN